MSPDESDGDGVILAGLDRMVAADSPGAIFAQLFGLFGLWIAGRLLHRQRFGTFFSPDRRIHAGLFLKDVVLGIVFTGVSTAVTLQVADTVRPQLDIQQVALLFVPLVVLIFI